MIEGDTRCTVFEAQDPNSHKELRRSEGCCNNLVLRHHPSYSHEAHLPAAPAMPLGSLDEYKVFTSDIAAGGRRDDGLHRRDALGTRRRKGDTKTLLFLLRLLWRVASRCLGVQQYVTAEQPKTSCSKREPCT